MGSEERERDTAAFEDPVVELADVELVSQPASASSRSRSISSRPIMYAVAWLGLAM
jgi:hypothetical protein